MELRKRIQGDLRGAMVARDGAAVRILRSLLAEFDHAGAVDPGASGETAEPVDPTRGWKPDVPRRELSASDGQEIVRREIQERLDAIAEYNSLGQHEAVRRLRAEVNLISRYAAS